MFTEKQIAYMRSIGLNIDFEHISGEDWVKIEDMVGNRLMDCGFDDDYEPNQDGLMCESIIDVIPK